MLSHYMPKHKKNANILRFKPPGFQHTIDFPFPGRCLPVCQRCKKNFKTREHCRTRDCHTGLPWSNTFLCVSLDPTCTGEDGKLLEGPFIATSMQPQPFCLQGDIDPLKPICAPCKGKNYTRTYCRSNKKHRQLPWSTVHVLISLRPESMYPDSNEMETQAPRKRRKTNSGSAAEAATESLPTDGGGVKNGQEETQETKEVSKEKEEKQDDEMKNKFDDIPPSRTFLCTVSAKMCLIEWLDVDPMIQAAMSRKEKHEITGRIPNDPGFPPYGMMPYSYMNFPGGPPGKGGGDPSRGNIAMPGNRFMGGQFPGGSFGGQDMLALNGSYMPPGMNYGGFPSPQHVMQFDATNNMPRDPRHGGEMPQGNMPSDSQHGMPHMPWFNQSDITSQMHFDRMSRGTGQDLMPSQIPPHMWPMTNQFMRGSNGNGASDDGCGPHGGNTLHGGGAPHGDGAPHDRGDPPGGGGGDNNAGSSNRLGNPMANNGSNNDHAGDKSSYGGEGYPLHPRTEGGGMVSGGGSTNSNGEGGPPPQRHRPPQQEV